MGGGGAPGDGAGAPAADALSSGSPASGQAATAGAGVVQPVPILATKLYVPQPRSDVVPRPQLLDGTGRRWKVRRGKGPAPQSNRPPQRCCRPDCR
jgi:hypothetical protein